MGAKTLFQRRLFTAFASIFRKMETIKVGLLGLAFCYLIEISQLYHAPWIDKIRNTTLGGLVLGYGFLWSDLLAYLIGIGAGVVIDLLLMKTLKNKA